MQVKAVGWRVDMETVSVLLSVLCVSAASAQCNKDPSLFITAPKTMEALTGSCLMIPCNFSTIPPDLFISTGTIYGVWIKNDPRFGLNPSNVIYNSSITDNVYPINITGNLSQKNCTTMFSDLKPTYTDMYYFRIDGTVKATDSCVPVKITVRDSPGSPRVQIPGDLREGVSVTVTCSAFTPCPHLPPKLTWSLRAEPDMHREQNIDGTFTTRIQETITLSDQHDGHNITCSVSYPVAEGTRAAETLVTLSVSYAPKDTSASISPSALVEAGTWVNLTCHSRAKPPVSNFTWFQISTDGAKAVSEGAFYTFNATGGGVYYCVASNGLGGQKSPEVRLAVGGTEPLLGAVVGGIIGVVVLLCVVIVTWLLKSKGLSPQTQAVTGEDPKTDETIHYGEINFSNLRREPSADSRQLQDTVYAQVKVSERGKAAVGHE